MHVKINHKCTTNFLHKITLKNGYILGLNTDMDMHFKNHLKHINTLKSKSKFLFSAEYSGGETAAIRCIGSICLISYLVGNQEV